MSAARDVLALSCAVLGARNGAVCVFKVYVDESGIHDSSPVVTVGAYIARPKQWAAFTSEWNRAIKPIDVYHATDAAAAPPRGAFAGWTKEQVAALCAKALPIIPKHTEMAFAAGIQMDDYRAAIEKKPHLAARLGEPYGACLQWVLSYILRLKKQQGNVEQIAFFHEQNKFAKEAYAVYEYLIDRYQIGGRTTFAFGSKEKYVPLQAADIYAYECNKRLRNPIAPNRRSLDALVPQPGKASLQFFNRDNMGELITRLEFWDKIDNEFTISEQLFGAGQHV